MTLHQPPSVGQRAPRQELGLPEDKVVLGYLGPTELVDRPTYLAWLEILSRAPGAVLWLPRRSSEAAEHLHRDASLDGVDPRRVIISGAGDEPPAPRAQLADIIVDPIHASRSAPSEAALGNGVPLLTHAGPRPVDRIAANLARLAGVPECICPNPAEYIETGIRWVETDGIRSNLGRRLKAQQGQVFEAQSTATAFQMGLIEALSELRLR